MQAQAAHGDGDRFAMHRLIYPVPVIRRKTGNFREPLNIERFVEVIVNMVEHAVQTCFVTRPVSEIVHIRECRSELRR